MPIPISLMVDDGAPVNPMFFHDPTTDHPLLIPNALARDFAGVCESYGVRGKFSVLPMPFCLGGIDGKLNRVPARQLAGFLKIVREKIMPRFDITPEILTHFSAYRLKGGFHHLYEDEWVARASIAEMTDYIALALEMLAHVGLPANGVTSPWSTGIRNEAEYAEAIGTAQWRIHKRAVTWYFLHVRGAGLSIGPTVSRRDSRTGQTVVSIPAATNDPFWNTQRPMARTRSEGRKAALAGVDSLLSADGKKGRITEVIAEKCPVLLLTHWQSLFSDGTMTGLWGLEQLLERLQRRYGADLAWITCDNLAREAAKK